MTGCPLLIKILRQGIPIGKKIMRQSMGRTYLRVLSKQWIPYTFGKIFCATGHAFGVFFMRQGTGYGEATHTPPSFP